MTQPSTTPASACRHTKPTRRSRPKPDPSGPADAPTDPSYSRLTLPSAYDGHPHAPIGGSGLAASSCAFGLATAKRRPHMASRRMSPATASSPRPTRSGREIRACIADTGSNCRLCRSVISPMRPGQVGGSACSSGGTPRPHASRTALRHTISESTDVRGGGVDGEAGSTTTGPGKRRLREARCRAYWVFLRGAWQSTVCVSDWMRRRAQGRG